MITDEEQQALDRLGSATLEERAEAAAVLARGSGHDVDTALLKLFHAAAEGIHGANGSVRRMLRSVDHAELISRVLAERDPDRDPAYVDRLFQHALDDERRYGALVGAEEWGFPRLRRLKPVEWYADQLHYQGMARWLPRLDAVASLGDTVDPAAFDVLLPVLSDQKTRMRGTAVQAVRRLVRTGLGEECRAHPVRQRLADTLVSEPHRKVRLEVARTLCVLGDEALVADALSEAPWWQRKWKRELETCLRGDIPPLPKMWSGDQTV